MLFGRTVTLLSSLEICGSLAAPKSPVWSSGGGGFDWPGSEGTSSLEDNEHNADYFALEVLGQDWSGEVVSLFLEDWELRQMASSCHMTLYLPCQEMRDACCVSSESRGSPLSLCSQCQGSSHVDLSQQQSLLSPWTGCDNEREGCGERMKEEGTRATS